MSFIQLILVFSSYVIVISDGKMQPFIAGGGYADIHEFPYAVFISIECVNDEGTTKWMCSGSIANQYLMLTAAHCFYSCSPKSALTVLYGHENLDKARVTTVYSFATHPHFNEHSGASDIAMAKLNTELILDSRVSRVVLLADPPYREEALVAGWGITDEITEAETKMLKYVRQYVWDLQDCWNLLQTLPEGCICARDKDSSNYVAIGDSGSALMVRGYIQIGIVSFKLPVSASVVIYTDTGYFYDWIQKTAEKMLCTNH